MTVSALMTAGAAVTAVTAHAQQSGAQAEPSLKLIAAQNDITLPSYKGTVFLDPGIYVASMGAPLQFDVQRASYTKPVTITQVTGATSRRLPAWTVDAFNGLRQFFWLTVRNSHGKVVYARPQPFCPAAGSQPVGPGSPRTDPFPSSCAPFDPFPVGEVWGIPRDWATDPMASFGTGPVKLAPGNYTMTESVTGPYRKLFNIGASDATVTVKATVVPSGVPVRPRVRSHAPAALRPTPNVPLMKNPPRSALPDLVALPSWGISLFQTKPTPGHPSVATVNFGATVWIGGNGPLDVEGFRHNGSPTMPAYQYFWRGNKVIGRAPAGTMGFDSAQGHTHWHFQQFARYQLLNASKKLVLRSQKVGFCIAPTDNVNMLLPGSVWNPGNLGFTGACGSPTALSVEEMLPVGWGDTYMQAVAGQAFVVTNVPNGTYYIEITANPEGVLHELSTKNDTSFRKIILGGTTGHRTIRVPAWNGLDPGGR